MRNPREAFDRVLVPEALEDAREALLALSQQLYEIDERWSQFGVEARSTWLDAAVGLDSLEKVHAALLRARDLEAALVGFHETRMGQPALLAPGSLDPEPKEREDHDELLGDAVKACREVVRRLCAAVDHARRFASSPPTLPPAEPAEGAA